MEKSFDNFNFLHHTESKSELKEVNSYNQNLKSFDSFFKWYQTKMELETTSYME
jgi:hypothetical protein